MINVYSRQGNYAKIDNVYTTQTQNGATLYHFTLLVGKEESIKTKAVAYIKPDLNENMKKLAKVYAKFKAGDEVTAFLYKKGAFTDVYRLQRIAKSKRHARKPRKKQVVMASQLKNDEVHDIEPVETPKITF